LIITWNFCTLFLYILGALVKTTSVSDLRRNLQAWLSLAARGERVQITSHGRTIAELLPPSPNSGAAESARALLRGSVVHFTDPLQPAVDPSEWTMHKN
jgi:antitoxin (DNA-binding transcriptional repressor) of toxin-antitoxin stability system